MHKRAPDARAAAAAAHSTHVSPAPSSRAPRSRPRCVGALAPHLLPAPLPRFRTERRRCPSSCPSTAAAKHLRRPCSCPTGALTPPSLTHDCQVTVLDYLVTFKTVKRRGYHESASECVGGKQLPRTAAGRRRQASSRRPELILKRFARAMTAQRVCCRPKARNLSLLCPSLPTPQLAPAQQPHNSSVAQPAGCCNVAAAPCAQP